MEYSKNYHGKALLNEKDLEESKISNKIELEYYTTNNYKVNSVKETEEKYSIEVVKKEYDTAGIVTESNCIENIKISSEKVVQIIETLRKHKVTPIGLNDVLEDLLKTNFGEEKGISS